MLRVACSLIGDLRGGDVDFAEIAGGELERGGPEVLELSPLSPLTLRVGDSRNFWAGRVFFGQPHIPPNMKTNILLLTTVLAASAALVTLIPVNAIAVAGNALLALGILAVFAIDYRRAFRPLAPPGQVLSFGAGSRSPAALVRAA